MRLCLGVLLGAVALFTVVACGARSASKAGGSPPPKSVVLTLASYTSAPVEAGAFASEVRRLSHGSIRIVFRNEWRKGEPNVETKLVRDVRAGRADIAWVGTREWDAFGDTSFDALHLPFLIDSYALEQAVLKSPLPGRMLQTLERLHVVGIGVLPGELRRVVGVRKPIVRLADFRGLRFGTTPARAALATVRALGATPVAFLQVPSVRVFGGFDFPITYFDQDKYDVQASYVTTNLAFAPRPLVLFMNAKVFDSLTSAQRQLLRDAARAAIPGAAAFTRTSERESMKALCARGRVRFVRASATDLAKIRQAIEPVLESVDAQTRRYEGEIERVKRILGVPVQTLPACPPATSSGGALPDGIYTNTMTAANGRRAHIRVGDPFYKDLPIRRTLVIRGRTFTIYDKHADGHTEVSMEGIYSSYRGKVRFETTAEKLLPFSWSFDGHTLRFFDLPFHGTGYYGAEFAPPWTKTG